MKRGALSVAVLLLLGIAGAGVLGRGAVARVFGQTVRPVVVTCTPNPAFVGDPVNCTASITHPAESTLTSIIWDAGDGTVVVGQTSFHAYAAPGSYQVTLSVIDSYGNQWQGATTVIVRAPPPTATVAPQPAVTASATPQATRLACPDGSQPAAGQPCPSASPTPSATPAADVTPLAPDNPQVTPLDGTRLRVDWVNRSPGASTGIADGVTGGLVVALPPGVATDTLVNLDPGTQYCIYLYSYTASATSAPTDIVCGTTPAADGG